MDPLTIAGLVSNILQFLSFSHEVLSTAREIWSSTTGTAPEVDRLRDLINDIAANTRTAGRAAVAQGADDSDQSRDSLGHIARDCEEIADKLLRQLASLETKGRRGGGVGRKLEAVKVSVVFGWKKGEINRLKGELLVLEGRLNEWWNSRVAEKRDSFLIQAIQDLTRGMEKLQAQSPGKVLEDLQSELNHSILDLNRRSKQYRRVLGSASASRDEEILNRAMSEHVSRLNAAVKNFESLLSEVEQIKKQSAVIRSLQFPSIRRRQGEIEAAHGSTLGWVFDRSVTNFVDWLEYGRGVYWLNGLAGSGKSTLMKFVSQDDRTAEALRAWSFGQRVLSPSHYFWNAGTEMQKSQQGLLQSLLYDILRSAPQLVAAICPDHGPDDFWDVDELKLVFKRLSTETDLGVKFCFFIDGLDEYGGAEEDIIDVVKHLALSPHIKVCVSSRPWNAFSAEWAASRDTLRVQDFTKGDMAKYVREKLVDDPRFTALAARDERSYELVHEISDRASGVWLWVYLAVRDLLRDMRDNEGFDQLMRRLNSYPRELHRYFEDIMRRIDPIYHEVSAQIFLLVVAAVRPLSILALTALDAWTDSALVMKLEISPITNVEVTALNRLWQPRLQSRCRDLLKITYDEDETSVFRYQIDFLHRTVRDFLRDNHQDELHKQAPKGFDATLCLARLVLVFVKRMNVPNFRTSLDPLIALVDELLLYAWLVEQLPPDTYSTAQQPELLDELDRTMSHHARSETRHWTNARDPPINDEQESYSYFEGGQATFLALAIQARLRQYTAQTLSRDPTQATKKPGRPLLDYALRPKRVTPVVLPYNLRYDIPAIDASLVRYLLISGADPNHKVRIYDGQTPWALFLDSCRMNWDGWSPGVKEAAYRAMVVLVQHGADLQVTVPALGREPNAATALYHQPVVLERSGRQGVAVRELVDGCFFPGLGRWEELVGVAPRKQGGGGGAMRGVLGRFLPWVR